MRNPFKRNKKKPTRISIPPSGYNTLKHVDEALARVAYKFVNLFEDDVDIEGTKYIELTAHCVVRPDDVLECDIYAKHMDNRQDPPKRECSHYHAKVDRKKLQSNRTFTNPYRFKDGKFYL